MRLQTGKTPRKGRKRPRWARKTVPIHASLQEILDCEKYLPATSLVCELFRASLKLWCDYDLP